MGIAEYFDPDILRMYAIAFFWAEFSGTALLIMLQKWHIAKTKNKIPPTLHEFPLYDQSVVTLSAQHMNSQLTLDLKLKLYEIVIWTVVVASEFIPFVWTEFQLADSDFDFIPDFFDYEIRSSISFAFWFALFELIILDLPKKLFPFKLQVAYGFQNKSLRAEFRKNLEEVIMHSFNHTFVNFCLAVSIQIYDQRFQQKRASIRFGILLSIYVVAQFIYEYILMRFEYLDRKTFYHLPEGELKSRIAVICRKTGYPIENVRIEQIPPDEQINAFCFSFFGLFHRIGFTSNLIEGSVKGENKRLQGLNTREIEGIFAHEVGHWMGYHVEISFLLRLLLFQPIVFGLSIWFREQKFTYEAFGFRNVSSEPYPILPGLFVAQYLILRILDRFQDLIENVVTRITESAADAYSVPTGYARNLQEGLAKLKYQHLGYPTSNWMYTMMYDHHPTVVDRIDNINVHWDEWRKKNGGAGD